MIIMENAIISQRKFSLLPIGRKEGGLAILLCALMWSCSLLAANGNSEYSRLLDEGKQALGDSYTAAAEGDLSVSRASAEKAFSLLHSAEMLRPAELDPIFFAALSQNQMGDFRAAISRLDRLRRAHYSSPDLAFAHGYALVHCEPLGSPGFEQGRSEIKRYTELAAIAPDQTDYPNLGEAKKLLKKLKMLTSPNISATKGGDAGGAPEASIPTELPFVASVQSGPGYNDNVINLGKGLPLPANTPTKSAYYEESSLTLTKDITLPHSMASSPETWLDDKLSLSYIFVSDNYDGLSAQDRILNTASASYKRAFTETFAGLSKASDQWLYVDGELTTNLATLQTALLYTPTSRQTSQISYYFNRIDGYKPTTLLANPSGFIHRAEVLESYVLLSDPFDLTPRLTVAGQYAHEWTITEGVEGRYQRNDFLAKLEWKAIHRYEGDDHSFIRGLTMTLSDEWQPDRYEYASFPSVSSPDAFALLQHTNTVVAGLSLTMWYDEELKNAKVADANRMEFIVQYRFTSRDANVAAKTYDQNMIITSLKFNF
jgi:hypothetical protein